MKNVDLIHDRMLVGAHFLSFFPSKRSSRAVAKLMGLSRARVLQLEKLAAWKVVMRMRQGDWDGGYKAP